MSISIASHLVTPRFGYQHHGLFTGNNQVIHLTSNDIIEEVSLSDFTQGNGYQIQKYHSKFSQQEIINRARSRLGYEDYSVMFNNCESFVNWCIHDKSISNQVRTHAALTGSLGAQMAINSLIKAPAIANLTIAEMAAATTTGSTGLVGATGITLLSTTPIVPAAIVGYGVYKLVQFLKD